MTTPPPVKTIAETWPFLKLTRPVRVGKGLAVHGSTGVTTACGKVWRETLGFPTDPADRITCKPCRKILDQRNTYNRRLDYSVRVNEEQDAFAAGVPVADATAWRGPWNAGNHDNEGGYPITPRSEA